MCQLKCDDGDLQILSLNSIKFSENSKFGKVRHDSFIYDNANVEFCQVLLLMPKNVISTDVFL